MARGCNDHRADLETGQMELDDGSDDGWSRMELHPLHLHSKYFKSERWSLKDAARIGHWAAGFSTETANGPDWTGLDRAGQFQPPASLISTRQSSISANSELQPHCWLKWNNYFSTQRLTDSVWKWIGMGQLGPRQARPGPSCICILSHGQYIDSH